jgi:hypothetical protein
MLPTLIGVHGPLDGGKDTVANYIQSKFPEKFGRYAFAGPIKQACMIMFGFTKNQMEDRKLKEAIDPFWGFTPRKTMQLLGTEYGRDMLRDDIWIRRAEMEINKNSTSGRGTIITDVRFENEAAWLRTQPGAMLIYLTVPNLQKDERYQHASEAGIKLDVSFDKLVTNDKAAGLAQLFQQINKIFDYDREKDEWIKRFSARMATRGVPENVALAEIESVDFDKELDGKKPEDHADEIMSYMEE